MTAKTIRVDVTAEDIARGLPHSVDACPVARALTRTMRMPHDVTTAIWNGHSVGVATMLGLGARVRLSRSVGTFVRRFDAGEPVEPFTFRVVR